MEEEKENSVRLLVLLHSVFISSMKFRGRLLYGEMVLRCQAIRSLLWGSSGRDPDHLVGFGAFGTVTMMQLRSSADTFFQLPLNPLEDFPRGLNSGMHLNFPFPPNRSSLHLAAETSTPEAQRRPRWRPTP